MIIDEIFQFVVNFPISSHPSKFDDSTEQIKRLSCLIIF